MTILELEGASDRTHVVERGLLDQRAILAFSQGQCHSLALAVRQKVGWSLVAIQDPAGTITHVCNRRPDGLIVDILGARETSAVACGDTVIEVDEAGIDRLVTEHGWAAPAIGDAESWTNEVIARGSSIPPVTPFEPTRFAKSFLGQGWDVRIEWDGSETLEVRVRPCGTDVDRIQYGLAPVPLDRAGRWRIDFTPEQFESLASSWLNLRFDPRTAQSKFAGDLGATRRGRSKA